jgi:hypothetical protein
VGNRALALMLEGYATNYFSGFYPYCLKPDLRMRGYTHNFKVNYEVAVDEKWGPCKRCYAFARLGPLEWCIHCQKKLPYAVTSCVKAGTRIVEGHDRDVFRRGNRKPKLYTGLYPVGPILGARPQTSDDSNSQNELTALVRRVAVLTQEPDDQLWKDFEVFVLENIKKLLKIVVFDLQPPTKQSFEDWNARFPKARRAENLKVADRVIYSQPKAADSKQCFVKAFIKYEKSKNEDYLGQIAHVPRLIQAFPPLVTVSTALYMNELQGWLHEAFKRGFPWLRFVAGDNAETLSLWFNENYLFKTQITTDDFSFYDSTFSVRAHQTMLKVYRLLSIHKHPWAKFFRPKQVSPKGYTRCGLTFSVVGTMRSGAADTCLANSFIQLFSHWFALRLVNKQPIEDSVVLAGLGDDNIILSEPRVRFDGVEEILKQLGFLPKLNINVSRCQAVFLNMVPWPSSSGYKFAPLPGRLMSRLGWSTKQRTLWQPYMYGVAFAFKASTHHVPLLNYFIQGILKKLSKFDRKYEESLDFFQEYGYRPHFSTVYSGATLDTLAFFYERYGFEPIKSDLADLFLDWVSTDRTNVGSARCVLYHPLLERMVDIDNQ